MNSLSKQAAIFSAVRDAQERNNKYAARLQKPLRLLVADFEFIYDLAAYRHYKNTEVDRDAEADKGKRKCRWPFHHICGGAWVSMTFYPGETMPEIGQIQTMTAKSASEVEIARAFFAAAENMPDALLCGWGSEQKDYPVARRIAGEHGLCLPFQLLDLNPHARSRLDLCNGTSNQAASLHLPEYCIATGIPCKPIPSAAIGNAVLSGDWQTVEEQAAADVFSAAVIAVRHLVASRQIKVDVAVTEQLIAASFADQMPHSAFFRSAGIRMRTHRAQPLTWAA